MKLDQLESFYEVVRQGSFSAAAETLNVSKGLVSRHVRHLESDLNAKLLHRTTRSVGLTEAGEHLYQQAAQIFALARSAKQGVQDLTQEASGILRFTAPITLGERVLGDILPRFWETCPQVRVETRFTARAFRLVDGDQDIALRAYDTLPEGVVAKSLGRMRNVLVASPGYLQRRGMPQKPIDLLQHDCILFNHMPNGSFWQLDHPAGTETIKVDGPLSVSQYSTVQKLAIQGLGIGNLPYYQVESALADNRLVPLLTEYRTGLHDIYILHASHLYLPKKLRVFKQILCDWFDEHEQYLAQV